MPSFAWAQLAAEYRAKFGSDVVVDLIGYRRHGHSEVDDPTITQPRLYERIKNHPQLWKIYAQQIGVDPARTVEAVRAEYEVEQTKAHQLTKQPHLRKLPDYWKPYHRGKFKDAYEVETGVSREELAEISAELVRAPEGFHVHPKIVKLLEQRAEMGNGKRLVDYGYAEALALGSLLRHGTPVRLSGQDTQRGTFNQRHAALIDTETETEYVPLAHVSHIAAAGRAKDGAFCEIYNSSLSEAACLGFEYGFSRDYPEALVLWEAQFGDFVNGAQVIIDQFISAAEDKWDLPSGLVLLLPHGYEGQGPEHSSARIERFLQLAGEENIQVCQPSNAAQYFHLLRRQALRPYRKPLIVFTPKSMLRNPEASSPIEAFQRAEISATGAGHGGPGRAPHSDRQRQSRPRTARRTPPPCRHQHRHFLSGSALPASAQRDYRRARSAPERPRSNLGAGRAAQHGSLFLRLPAPRPIGASARPAPALRQAQRQRQPRHWIRQSARTGAKDAAGAGVYHHCRGIICNVFPYLSYVFSSHPLSKPRFWRAAIRFWCGVLASFTRHSHAAYLPVMRNRDTRACLIQSQVSNILHAPTALFRPTVHFRRAALHCAHST